MEELVLVGWGGFFGFPPVGWGGGAEGQLLSLCPPHLSSFRGGGTLPTIFIRFMCLHPRKNKVVGQVVSPETSGLSLATARKCLLYPAPLLPHLPNGVG